MVACWAHNPEVLSSNLSPAPNFNQGPDFAKSVGDIKYKCVIPNFY